MGRRRQTTDLHVFMNGLTVGTLTRQPNGVLAFSYHLDWLQSDRCRPISLSMPLRLPPYRGGVVENFFDNLLPDSLPIRRRLQARFGAPSDRCFDLLWHIGRDCVGALQLSPDKAAPEVRKITCRPLRDSEIAEILKNYRTMPLGMRDDEDFRISLAGAQEKTAFLHVNGQWHLPLGPTPSSHIFKLPIGRIEQSGLDLSDSVENEWLCHQILQAYGLPVARVEMARFDDVKALVVERFDRRWATDGSWLMRLPQEDMCQALNIPPALKYESQGGPGMAPIMDLLLGSVTSLEDRRTFIATNVLFWMLAAIDGHAKNFSIFLLPENRFRLTPNYDVISAWPLVSQKQLAVPKLKMAMALTGRNRHYEWNRMLYRHWLTTAGQCRFPAEEMAAIIDEMMARLDEVIAQVAARLPATFPAAVAEPVFAGMRQAREQMTQSK